MNFNFIYTPIILLIICRLLLYVLYLIEAEEEPSIFRFAIAIATWIFFWVNIVFYAVYFLYKLLTF